MSHSTDYFNRRALEIAAGLFFTPAHWILVRLKLSPRSAKIADDIVVWLFLVALLAAMVGGYLLVHWLCDPTVDWIDDKITELAQRCWPW